QRYAPHPPLPLHPLSLTGPHGHRSPALSVSQYPSSAATPRLSLHDALPILLCAAGALIADPLRDCVVAPQRPRAQRWSIARALTDRKSTPELQSLTNLVCRLLLEKKKNSSATSLAHLRRVSTC